MTKLISKKIIEKTKNFIICEMNDDSYAALFINDSKYYYNAKDYAIVLSKVMKFEKTKQEEAQFFNSKNIVTCENNWGKEAFHNFGGLFK
jgi:hypothetical protein